MSDTPYTISYVVRKRQQIDNLYELEQAKRPPDIMIWDGTVEEIEDWLDKIFKKHDKNYSDDDGIDVIIDEIEE